MRDRPEETLVAAHIMLVSNEKTKEEDRSTAERKIKEIYNELKAGANFEELVSRYSEDKSSVNNKGVLQPFGINKNVP